jgi:hypothetical protein
MVHRIAIILLVVCCSCGLGELRGHDAYVREANAREIIQEVETLRSTPVEDVTVQEEVLVRIEERAKDEVQRAQVAQQDHGYTPSEPVEPKSQKADAKFMEYAGTVHSKTTRRRKLKELPGKIARGAAKVAVGLIPAPIRVMLKVAAYAAVVMVLGTVLFWVWRKMRYFRKAAIEAVKGANRLPKEQRKEAFGDMPTLKDVYRRNGIE